MFGQNEIVGQKFFSEVYEEKLFVTSMFMTLQGEGPYRGRPAFFIRLAKCNLNCSFCDTFFDDGDWLTFEEIDQKITKTIEQFYIDKNIPLPDFARNRDMVLVMTGGEPMLQKHIGGFLRTIGSTFTNTQIESNGTLLQNIPDETTLVVSPKCYAKDGKDVAYLTLRKEVLDRANCLKFVMSSDLTSPYSSIPEWAKAWADNTKKQVFISPMNIYNKIPEKSKMIRASSKDITLADRSTKDEVVSFWEDGLLNLKQNQLNHEYVAQYCVQHGYTMNMQIHLFASLA